MISFSSNIVFADEYFDYTDYAIGLERAYEAFEEYINKAFVNLEYSFESADENENKSTFIQRLKKIWDTVINFFTTAIKKLKDIIKRAWNTLFKSDYSKDSVMSKKVWVLYSWITAIRNAYKKKEVPPDTYDKIYNLHMSEYLKAAANKADLSIKKQWTKIPDIMSLEAFEFTDELQFLKRVQAFLTKLSESNNAAAIKRAVQHGQKADINQGLSTGIPGVKMHKAVRSQSITYLASLISKSPDNIDLSQLKLLINDAVKFVKSQAKCILGWVKHVAKCMNDSHQEIYGSKGILKIFKVPADVKKALENHYRTLVPDNSHPLAVQSVIVYSPGILHDPRFSDNKEVNNAFKAGVDAKKSRLGGATNPGGFKNDSGKGMFKGKSIVIPSDKISMSVDKIAFLIIHEFGHCYDDQSFKSGKHGKRSYAMNRASNVINYKKNYDNDPMENFANRAAAKAMAKLDGELSCVKSWIQKIKNEIESYSKKINYKGTGYDATLGTSIGIASDVHKWENT